MKNLQFLALLQSSIVDLLRAVLSIFGGVK